MNRVHAVFFRVMEVLAACKQPNTVGEMRNQDVPLGNTGNYERERGIGSRVFNFCVTYVRVVSEMCKVGIGVCHGSKTHSKTSYTIGVKLHGLGVVAKLCKSARCA